jgi:hypothetical protein
VWWDRGSGFSEGREEHHTLFYGKPRPAERVVRVVAAVEGLGIRAAARVFEVEPNTVLTWLRAAADQLAAFSCLFRSRGAQL